MNKFYYYYQIKSKALQRLKFILKKDIDFNYKIINNILYLYEKPIFYIIDAVMAF